jgi:aminodeoxyfutalosine deaminase
MNDETYTIRARRIAAMIPGREIIPDGAVVVNQGRVLEVGAWGTLKSRSPAEIRDLGEVTLLPGLINAHTHLELSHIGLPPFRSQGFLQWVRWLISQSVVTADGASLANAVAQLATCETAGVADITSRHPKLVAGALEAMGIDYVLQYERFGYQGDSPLPDIPLSHLSLAGHSLYSTSPESLRQAKEWDLARGRVFSMHLAEHEGEVELLATGRGDFAAFMKERILPKDFEPPGLSPVAWADALGLLDARTLAVHAVHVSPEDIRVLKERGVTLCLCPRSNEVIGVGRADAQAMLDAGVPCCLGTDSLASTPDLNLWEELRCLHQHINLTLAEAVAMLTTTAAGLFGFEGLGRITPGALPRFAVLPSDLEGSLQD